MGDMTPSPPNLVIEPVTAERMDALEALFRTGMPGGCWDMEPRLVPAESRACLRRWQAEGTSVRDGRREQFRALLDRAWAPGLIAFRDGEPVGWVSVGPRGDFQRIDKSRTTPPVDDLPVWIIPCLYVHRKHRGHGVAVALLEAAVSYAAEHGAPAVEGYPRESEAAVSADAAYFGTVALFRKAGFEVVRPSQPGIPKNWVPRATMRRAC
jgi:GNAT superfamily N-acetyltransferase